MAYTMNDTAFAGGIPAKTFIATMKNYRALTQSLHREVAARFSAKAESDTLPEFAPQLRAAAAAHAQPIRATLMTEDWCGDSACNLPLLAELLPAAGIELRVFRGSEHAALQQMYHQRGIDHIPVLSLWDGACQEVGTWVERPAACAPRVDAWKQAHPQLMQLYQAKKTSSAAEKQFAVLYRQMLEEMAGWYRQELWLETARELLYCVTKPVNSPDTQPSPDQHRA